MIELIIGIFIGIISGFIASFVFWKYILHQKPKIKIGPKIVKSPSRSNASLNSYVIKFLNVGKRPVINVRCEVQLVKKTPIGNGFKRSTRIIPLAKDYAFIISPLRGCPIIRYFTKWDAYFPI
ncbi:MAG: hypothetical protein KAT65_22040 [Methanophagales archaeon]|nr:hypothetical protein [Methanophagales archaeon]